MSALFGSNEEKESDQFYMAKQFIWCMIRSILNVVYEVSLYILSPGFPLDISSYTSKNIKSRL